MNSVPPVALKSGAAEVLRVWAKPDAPQQLTLQVTWDDPGAWGLLLVDIARHAAKAYSDRRWSESGAFERMMALFKAELGSPTDDPMQLS